MDTKNNVLIIGIITLVIGAVGGYAFGVSRERGAEPAVTMHGAMSGMMMGLEGKQGSALEEAFIDEMIVHHEGAVEMARILLAGTERPELVKLGNDIITAQTGEIEMMKRWRTEWFGR
jgi:uncharacterized protein (DUF305 family)